MDMCVNKAIEIKNVQAEKTVVETGEKIRIQFEVWYETDYPFDYPYDYPITSINRRISHRVFQ